jgi:glutamate synthase (NADPH/NADH) large chain
MTDLTPSTVTGFNTARPTATVEKNTAFPGLPKNKLQGHAHLLA